MANNNYKQPEYIKDILQILNKSGCKYKYTSPEMNPSGFTNIIEFTD